MDLSQEIDQMERARTILKDETVEHRNEILKAINPLHVISRVSQLSLAKSKDKSIAANESLADSANRVELSNTAEHGIEEHMGLLMTKNTALEAEPQARKVTEALCKRQIDALAHISIGYVIGQQTELTFSQALNFFEQNCLGISKFAAKQYKDSQAPLANRIA